jgi:N-acetylneuraminate synthase/N,N'-diacetyllegionaminate synthase
METKNKRQNIRIGKKLIGDDKPCFIIAEAGSNHNSDLETARRLISTAAEMGADAIKFQLFTAEGLSNEEKTQEILTEFEFNRKWLPDLKAYADWKGIIFLATPFDEDAVNLLQRINIEAYKVASGDLTYSKLIEQIAKKKKPILLSVGMASYDEIAKAVQNIQSAGNREIILLHCVADYPTNPEDVNLRLIKELRDRFGFHVGFSDHTLGIHVSAASICYGTVVIEKHFTLNRRQRGPDHSFAIEPNELRSLVRAVRDLEKARGDGIRRSIKCEEKGLVLGRRSLFARRDIPKDSMISEEDIKAVRPVVGISSEFVDSVIGKKAKMTMKAGEPITWEKIL